MDEFTVRTTQQLPTLLKAFRKTAKLTQTDVAERLMALMNILGVDLVLRARAAPVMTPPLAVREADGPSW
ncbi:XRE family transcriptional regulator [Diaphorobacter sp.]|uniref:XRE family transcriptional regulator n=1 Tax=Diaphorobacter sp. TaxID=1934310 RepID=UPI0028AC1AAF|nr:XRE family transcriptional regulator [Diaphorobacter sp.]